MHCCNALKDFLHTGGGQVCKCWDIILPLAFCLMQSATCKLICCMKALPSDKLMGIASSRIVM